MQDWYFDKFRSNNLKQMPKHNRHDEDKFVLILIVLSIALLMSGVLGSCRSKESVVNNRHVTADTLVAKAIESDTLISVREVEDTVHTERERTENTYVSHYEKADTLYKSFTDKWTHTVDSMAIKVDSTGQYTLHYYTRTHERDVQHDTIVINNVERDTIFRDTWLKDSLRMVRSERDSLRRIAERTDSTYRAVRDSIDNRQETVITKELTWWDRLKAGLNGTLISMALICLMALAAVIWYKKK